MGKEIIEGPLRLIWATAPDSAKVPSVIDALRSLLDRETHAKAWIISHRGNREAVRSAIAKAGDDRLIHVQASWVFDDRNKTCFRQTRDVIRSVVRELDRQVSLLPSTVLSVDLAPCGPLPLRSGMLEAAFILAQTVGDGTDRWRGFSLGHLPEANGLPSCGDPAAISRCDARSLLAIHALLDEAPEADAKDAVPPQDPELLAALNLLKQFGWTGGALPAALRRLPMLSRKISIPVLLRAAFWQAGRQHPCGLDPDLLVSELWDEIDEEETDQVTMPVRSPVRILHLVQTENVHRTKPGNLLKDFLTCLKRSLTLDAGAELILVIASANQGDHRPSLQLQQAEEVITSWPGKVRRIQVAIAPEDHGLLPQLGPCTMRQAIKTVRPFLGQAGTIATVAGPGWWRLLLDRWQRSGLLEQRRFVPDEDESQNLPSPALLTADDCVLLPREAPMLSREAYDDPECDAVLPSLGHLLAAARAVSAAHVRWPTKPCRVLFTGSDGTGRHKHAERFIRQLRPIPANLDDLSEAGVAVVVPSQQAIAEGEPLEVEVHVPNFDEWPQNLRKNMIQLLLKAKSSSLSEVEASSIIKTVVTLRFPGNLPEVTTRLEALLKEPSPRLREGKLQLLCQGPSARPADEWDSDYWRSMLDLLRTPGNGFRFTSMVLGLPLPTKKATTRENARLPLILALLMDGGIAEPKQIGALLSRWSDKTLGGMKDLQEADFANFTSKWNSQWERCEEILFGRSDRRWDLNRRKALHGQLCEALRLSRTKDCASQQT